MNKFFLSLIIIFVFSTKSYSENLKFTKIVKLKNPWSASFINSNEMIITEKEGKIKILNLSSKKIFNLNHNLNYLVHGQGGLLDIIYKDENLWISYTEDRGDWKTSTSIAKAKINKNELNFKNIFQANPPIDSGYHFGSRLAVKGDYIFASAGERGS